MGLQRLVDLGSFDGPVTGQPSEDFDEALQSHAMTNPFRGPSTAMTLDLLASLGIEP